MPLVSVIIPSYDSIDWLEKSISSAVSQKGDFDVEILVVDDHSNDGSLELAIQLEKKIPQLVVYINPKKGANSARNYGFRHSKGDYIQWLDSDDYILDNKFFKQVAVLEKFQTVDIVYSDWRMDYYLDDQKYKEEVRTEKESGDYLKRIVEDDWQPPLSYLLRRNFAEKLDAIEAWNPQRKVAQDREYFNLAAIHGASFKYVPGLFSVYNQWSENSISKMDFKKRLEHNIQLEYDLIKSIQNQPNIKSNKKKVLISILKTDSLKACFYHFKLKLLLPVKWSEIVWSRIHFKMKIIIPFIWLYKNIQFYSNSTNRGYQMRNLL